MQHSDYSQHKGEGIMNKPSFWTLLGTIGQLSADISEAYADDNKIDLSEVINIGSNIIKKIDIDVSENMEQSIEILKCIADWLQVVSQDKKITIAEVIGLFELISESFDYDFDTTGISW